MKASVSNERTEDDGVEKNMVEMDRILVEEVGQFGWYQRRSLLLLAAVMVMSGWQAEYIFTAVRVNTRCEIPECESTSDQEFTLLWLLNAIPGSSFTDFENCQRFNTTIIVISTTVTDVINGTCPAALFDQSNTISCDSYVYETTDSVVYDYDLACDEWRRSLIGSIRTVGTLVALPITGYVSDRWGRRTALALNAFNSGWIGLTRYWVRTYVGFVVSQFVEAALGSGITSCVFVLILELVGPKYRVPIGATMNTCFALGQVTLGLIAWAVPNWQKLTLALYIPQLFTITYFWLVAESVRWYMCKGRYEKAEKVLIEVARVNKTVLSEKSLQALHKSATEEKRRQAQAREQQAQEPLLLVLLWRNKRVLLRCCVSPVWWITTTFIYYGLSINSVNMSGNMYVNYMAVSAIEVPGYWVAAALLGRVGRKPVLAIAFWACSICQIVCLFLPDNLYGASLTVYMFGKFFISVVVAGIYNLHSGAFSHQVPPSAVRLLLDDGQDRLHHRTADASFW